MNTFAEKIKQCVFMNKEEDILVFNHFLRSSVPGWALHKSKTNRNCVGLERTVMACHMVHHKKLSTDPSQPKKM